MWVCVIVSLSHRLIACHTKDLDWRKLNSIGRAGHRDLFRRIERLGYPVDAKSFRTLSTIPVYLEIR